MGRAREFVQRVGLTRETFRAAGNLAGALALEAREATTVTAPARPSYAAVGHRTALTLSDVFRAFSIHTTAAGQLELSTHKAGRMLATVPLIVRKPDAGCTRSEFVAETVASLAGDGNAFWKLTLENPADPLSRVLNARVVAPQLVVVLEDERGRITYGYAGEAGHPAATWQAWEVKHLKLMSLAGELRGLGPIQAAQTELRGALQLRDYSSLWFDPDAGAAMPNATLTTDQVLPPEQADKWATKWHERRDHRVRVLGSGLKFTANILSPKDAQFLESRTFTVTQMARLFGLPASLMLAALEGNSQSYANVEQDWIAYVRFSLMQYLRPIEEAWSELLANGTTVRFRTDSLLRSDTKTRYEGHQIGLAAGFLTPNEVRALEGLPPIAGGDELRGSSSSTPAQLPATKDAPAGQLPAGSDDQETTP